MKKNKINSKVIIVLLLIVIITVIGIVSYKIMKNNQ